MLDASVADQGRRRAEELSRGERVSALARLASAGLPPIRLLLARLSAGEPATDTAWVDQSRQLAMQLGGQLKTELTRAIAEGGPMAAINVCYLRAPGDSAATDRARLESPVLQAA